MANILIVTRTTGGISDGAQTVGNILDGQGHTVTVRNESDPVNSTGFDLVVLWDGSFAAGWAVEAVPIVASDNDVATALGLASSSSGGTGQTAINVIDAGHPIAVAAGLQAGLNTVSTGSTAYRLNPGAAAPGVAKIARDSTSTDDRIILAAIDQGGLLIDGETPAPARRVFFGQNQAENWTQLGEDLFLACCDWATGADDAEDATTLEADPFTAGASFMDATFELVTQANPMAVAASFADVTFSIDPGGFTLDADPMSVSASFADVTFSIDPGGFTLGADPMAVTASFADVTFSIDPGGFTLGADPMSVSASFTDAALNYDGVGLARTLTADPFAVAALFADAALRQVVTNSAQATRASVSISIGL